MTNDELRDMHQMAVGASSGGVVQPTDAQIEALRNIRHHPSTVAWGTGARAGRGKGIRVKWDAMLAVAPTPPETAVQAVPSDALRGVCDWLESALKCKDWYWDPDQQACAEAALSAARATLPTDALVDAIPVVAFGWEDTMIGKSGLMMVRLDPGVYPDLPSKLVRLEDVRASLARVQAAPSDELRAAAQEFVDRCERGEVRSKHSYARFKAALATVQPVQPKAEGWMPIKTAPKDGTGIYAFWPPSFGPVHAGCYGVAVFECGHWCNPEDSDDDYTEPTHWQPLPAAPTAEDRSQS